MATVKLSAYQTPATVLSTELNSLTSGNVSAVSSSPYDNTSGLWPYADAIISINFGSAPTVGNTLDLYMATSLDGTNYEEMPATGSTVPSAFKRVGSAAIEVATTGSALQLHIWGIVLHPGKMEFQLVNGSGVTLPASGSTVVLYPYGLTVA